MRLLIAILLCASLFGQYTPPSGGGGGSGTVTSIATTSPITGGTITDTGTIACANCATAAGTLTADSPMIGAGGKATAVGTKTGTGTVFVTNTSPTLVTPNIGAATGTSLSVTGTVTSGSGSGVAGVLDLAQGTLPSLGTTAVSLLAPTSVTSYGLLFPGAEPSANQVLLWGAPASSISTATFTTFASTNLTDTATLARLASANVFTTLQTITVGAANTGALASTGYSLTGSNTTSMVSLAGTVNTSGQVHVFDMNITNTASGAGSTFFRVQRSGTAVFSIPTGAGVNISITDSRGLTASGAGLFGGDVQAGSTSGFYWSSRNYITAPANGQVKLGNFDNNAGVTLDFTAAANEVFIKNFANNAAGTIKALYKSSDGTSGVTVTTCTGFKDGLCISGT